MTYDNKLKPFKEVFGFWDGTELFEKVAKEDNDVDIFSVEPIHDETGDYFVIVSADPDKLDITEFEGVEVKHRKGTQEEVLEYEQRVSAESARQSYQAFLEDY